MTAVTAAALAVTAPALSATAAALAVNLGMGVMFAGRAAPWGCGGLTAAAVSTSATVKDKPGWANLHTDKSVRE